MNKLGTLGVLSVGLSGCSTIGYPDNSPLHQSVPTTVMQDVAVRENSDAPSGDVTLALTFSGGGARAAALAYGVLEELRDTYIDRNGTRIRLLDEVDVISSVSGGSITAAYYGLYRDRIFTDFRQRVLEQDLQRKILNRVLRPLQWFSSRGRSDVATEVFEENGFGKATFGDMALNGPPLIIVNATDLSRGVRFSFTQSHFNLICSDLASFPVSKAVMASAAVPLLFDPVVLQNHEGCSPEELMPFLSGPMDSARKSTSRTAHIANAIRAYTDKHGRPYVHLVDGGISDNLGLRAVTDTIEMAGGVKEFIGGQYQLMNLRPSRHIVIIAVNASTADSSQIDRVSAPPSMSQTINAVSDAQIHLYNNESIDDARTLVRQWASELTTDDHEVRGYLVVVDLQNLEDDNDKRQVNKIPTTLGLPENDINLMIRSGRTLLKNSPDFKELLNSLARCVDSRECNNSTCGCESHQVPEGRLLPRPRTAPPIR